MAQGKLEVLFLTLYPEPAASPRYRVTQFLPALEARGLCCTVAPAVSETIYRQSLDEQNRLRPARYHRHELGQRVRQIISAKKYDVVFLQKAVMSASVRGFDRLLRQRARRLLYDIDDAVHLEPPHGLRGPWRAMQDAGQIRRIMGQADRVLAGNRWLVAEAEQCGGNARYFPTVVDTDRFRPAHTEHGAYRLGWIGNRGTTPHVAALFPLLRELPGVDVLLIGSDAAYSGSEPFTRVSWTIEDEVKQIQHCSVGLMPLPETDWARGKCALKALQYMACGIPCIATPFGAVLDIIEHGVNGWLARTDEEWHEAIEALRDPVLRARLGEAARATVETRFALKTAAPELAAEIEALA